ncbi:hypothetical protein RND81_03G117300 [Saponaria officinalis]|uniref:F-box domain-containing protein n=1 Tax=Saponaria officinalis TaxID=3572 RepID=A0AAW1M9Y8_SAPOF
MDPPCTKPNLMKILPQEILMDILTLLPTKLIGRCRCVSKSWRHLLSQPAFIRSHLYRTKHLTENELLMLDARESSQSDSDADALYTASIHCHLPDEITVSSTKLTFAAKFKLLSWDLPSCDGLILLEDDAKRTLLVNPTTKEVRELPVPSHTFDSFYIYTLYGLGYDHVNDDYKVVSPSYYHTEHEVAMVVHVYSIRNGTWKDVDSSLYEPRSVRQGTRKKVESFTFELGYSMCVTGVSVDGSLHWVATNTTNHSSFIVGFDLTEENLRIIPAPRSVYGVDFTYDIVGKLGGCLCMLNVLSRKETNIWVMKEYGVEQSWTKLTIVDGVSEYLPILCVPGRQEVVMSKDDHTEDEEWVMYNLDSANVKGITIQGATCVHFGGCFRETLVSPYYNHDPQRA